MKRIALFASVVGLVLVPAALAHLVSTAGVYTKDPLCVGGTSAIAEGPPQVLVDVYSQASNGVCLTAKSMPAGTSR
jgi:hypothetical protein